MVGPREGLPRPEEQSKLSHRRQRAGRNLFSPQTLCDSAQARSASGARRDEGSTRERSQNDTFRCGVAPCTAPPRMLAEREARSPAGRPGRPFAREISCEPRPGSCSLADSACCSRPAWQRGRKASSTSRELSAERFPLSGVQGARPDPNGAGSWMRQTHPSRLPAQRAGKAPAGPPHRRSPLRQGTARASGRPRSPPRRTCPPRRSQHPGRPHRWRAARSREPAGRGCPGHPGAGHASRARMRRSLCARDDRVWRPPDGRGVGGFRSPLPASPVRLR
ncbi:hypothetical protein MMMDOFMJ_0710 [Methylobacterium gnaphalii]|nr:hypothetical protein MMMDOFMJ_0710 [Methylobacterium gnaphalii]